MLSRKGSAIFNNLISLILIAVVFPFTVYAQPQAPPAEKKKKPKPMHKLMQKTVEVNKPNMAERAIDRADKAADKMANTIDKTAEKIDVQLAGKKYTKKKNESKISIKQLNVWAEGGNFKNSISYGINLRLPNLEKRFQLRFSSYDEQEETRDLQNRRFRTRPRENNPGAALLFFKKLGKVKTTFQPRLQIKDPLNMAYLLRFESEAAVKPIAINPRLDLFADPIKGTGEYFHLNFSYALSPKWEISLLNEEEYRERTNFFNMNHAITLDHSISERRGAGLTLSSNSNNLGGGFHLNQYTVSPAYSQELSEERLRYIFATFLTFTRAEAFKGDAGCSLQIEVIF